eukprot:gene19691-biopygen22059
MQGTARAWPVIPSQPQCSIAAAGSGDCAACASLVGAQEAGACRARPQPFPLANEERRQRLTAGQGWGAARQTHGSELVAGWTPLLVTVPPSDSLRIGQEPVRSPPLPRAPRPRAWNHAAGGITLRSTPGFGVPPPL